MGHLTNIDIDEVKRLRRRDYRRKTGLTIAEGYPEVKRAAKAGVPIRKLYLCPEIITTQPDEFDPDVAIEISKEDFAKIAFGSRLKGILAICEYPQKKLADLQCGSDSLIVILEGIEKPGNIGTIIRSCDGAGVDAVIMCDTLTDAFNHNVVRSSIGTVFHMPVVESNKKETLNFLKQKNVNILTASAKTEHDYTEADFSKGTAIVLGNEHEGLSPFWMEHADQTLKIPMLGEAECLNAAMSASILVYEALRQRKTNCVTLK